jgi:hypothetical protein
MAEIYIVEQGDYLMKIAKQFGFASWRIIYDHPENAELRKRRPNPDILRPGDEIYIPDFEPQPFSCVTDQVHKFSVPATKMLLQLTIKDSFDEPVKNARYELKLAFGPMLKGKTSDAGVLQEKIPIGTESAQLTIEERGISTMLHIGHLDPVKEPIERTAVAKGVQARLNNLGYDCGDVDGIIGVRTKAALKRFQADVMGRKHPDGEPDHQTLDKLVEHHAS